MSIISCTSPRPSSRILPHSSVTSLARGSLAARSSSPRMRISSPRRGAGTTRQARNALFAASILASIAAAVSVLRVARSLPSTGEWTALSPPVWDGSARPSSENRVLILVILSGRLCRLRLEDTAETVVQEVGKLAIFLADETGLRQLAGDEQIDHGADAGRGGRLDGRAALIAIDLDGEGLLAQAAILFADGVDHHHHHVLVGLGDGAF